MQMQRIDRRSHLTAEEFRREYLRKNKPVILTDVMQHWQAPQKWSLDFFKTNYGHLDVPVFSSNYSKPGKGYMAHDYEMRFDAFLDAISSGPSDLRLFLFDIFSSAPELREDFHFHTQLMDGWLTKFPFMFFGAPGSEVTLHYDIDCANVFLSQFHGTKRVILFAPGESEKIYHHPFTVKSLIDPKNPDLDRFPALKNVKGYDDILVHGETLFMPSRFWHYMRYEDFSFSLALRSQNSLFTAVRGGVNLATHFVVDKGLNTLMGKSWHDWKERQAYSRAKVYE